MGGTSKPSAFGMDDLARREASVELVILLFARCCEMWALVSNMVLYDPEIFSNDACAEVRNRLGRVHVFDYLECHKDTTNRPQKNHFVLDLTLHEDWKIADYMIRIASVEPGDSIVDPRWSGAEYADRRESLWFVPKDWLGGNVPQYGTISFTFVPPDKVMVRDRQRLAESLLGWQPIPPDIKARSST